MKTKKITSREFKSIFSRVPRLCVELVIRTKDGVLMTKRAIEPCRGQWHIPGGTMLFGETIGQAAKRVAKQELDIRINITGFAGIIEYRQKNYWGWPVGLAFRAEIASKKNIRLDRQASDFRFFKVIPKNTVKEHKRLIAGLE